MLVTLRRLGMVVFQATADVENIDHICAISERFLRQECGEVDTFDLSLALREALSNAMLHGCAGRQGAKVFCELTLTDDVLTVLVRDPGPGFDWRALPRREPEPDDEHGRGFHLIRAHADTVNFNEAGNELTFSKRYDCAGRPQSSVSATADGITFRPGRDLVASTVEGVRVEIAGLLAESEPRLTMDLDGVGMVDSLGMGLFVAVHNTLRARGGGLSLINVAPRIHALLHAMRLTSHFAVQKAGEG
ncbi:putative anti-sigma regulatory factor, serine/threonine protein kinase [Alkalidesulfovibrio alkalitolerans DSM 16529]|uniref:Putative anti-sigma regulatory factor, serine/threonine protein kinase n=1 Tax=Alkalidesulfovibrio alkalitolerans DSM 16529 TaxID=1121439 RepID=S7UM24_9BACT|nr:ATP-binding protein [Alkalidesulfovibrio alkalitolerans]EPR34979.1 putative anti-sigma regulatory factor, serine/threonine protein kinase [Alkalidesulfovibrio alkalitolerans DSM 16529]